MEKPKLVIAGPGGGKTHDLVDKIISCMTSLEPHRILAAITYTNAATASIKSRLEAKIKLPPNVFVGTTYSFFNSFILLPFGSLFGLVELDKLFVEFDIESRAEEITKRKTFADVANRKKYKNGVAANIVKGLLAKGVIPFEQIVKISLELIENKKIKALLCERIQFLFIDEFQDATSGQYTIFDHIRKQKKTTIYAVGDPEQYISNFTIKNKKPHFTKLPIMAFKNASQVEINSINKRSSIPITTFINNFNTQIQQHSENSGISTAGVFYITSVELSAIVEKFRELSKEVEGIPNFKRYYLAGTNAAYSAISEKYGLRQISNENVNAHSKLDEILNLICGSVHLPHKKFTIEYSLNPVEYRTMGIKLLRAPIVSSGELQQFLTNNLKLVLSDDIDIDRLFDNYQAIKTERSDIITFEFTSSIHKSKGLEAEAVLVVARTIKQLNKWLETEKDTRFADKSDEHRLGFVAFSRAKEILCIACLQTLDVSTRKKLDQFEVTICDPKQF